MRALPQPWYGGFFWHGGGGVALVDAGGTVAAGAGSGLRVLYLGVDGFWCYVVHAH